VKTFLDKIQAHYQIKSDDTASPLTKKLTEQGIMGPRYPRAKRKLSAEDIKKLDELFHKLNRMSRGSEFDKIQNEIDKLLGEK
jgi:hypothetical protein